MAAIPCAGVRMRNRTPIGAVALNPERDTVLAALSDRSDK